METAEALGRQVDGLWLNTAWDLPILEDDPLPGEGSNEDEDRDLMNEDSDWSGRGCGLFQCGLFSTWQFTATFDRALAPITTS
jgi:hypothetical protein